ncbi:hypothetical protein I546_1498 [Mycobacterium kansasii 732]|nr:hypothetical protein I546_1498 [Mycobacterium kansasii 732]
MPLTPPKNSKPTRWAKKADKYAFGNLTRPWRRPGQEWCDE